MFKFIYMESPLDPNNLYSNIPQDYDVNILYEIIEDEIKRIMDEIELNEKKINISLMV